jgi:exodeoxyribonuclease V beta subunit
MMDAFDIGNAPLEKGVTLLEASAGTGKTYTIEGIYLRLVAELGMSVGEILVCTFTNAATEELRQRIRSRLAAARDELRSGEPSDPAAQAALRNVGDGTLLCVRLAKALAGFDEARILTIHGFCNRVLSEHAFESASAFDRTLADDTARFAALAAKDFSRRMLARAPLAMLGLSMRGVQLEEDCARAYLKRGADRDTELRPASAAGDDPDALDANLRGLLESIRDTWLKEGRDVLDFLRDESRAKAPLRDEADGVERALGELAGGGPVTGELMSALSTLRTSNIVDNLKKKVLPPEFTILRIAGDFLRALKMSEVALVRCFMLEADSLVGDLREKSGTMGYDDLLYETAAALREGNLATVLKSRYRAALVDEFQDTDRLQWEIFGRVFADAAHWLYLIGDPKQSIYRFRGADVHAYMDAAASANAAWTLSTNWRSDALLVEAVNAVFSVRQSPFGMNGIEFRPAIPSRRDDPERAFDPGPELPREPMRFVLYDDAGAKESVGVREKWLLANLAGDVRALLDRGARIGTRALDGGDIAVIVRTHDQGSLVRDALTSVGVQSVQDTGESVFDSDEAGVFADFLAAMLAPDDPRLMKWALAGPFFSLGAADLAKLGADDEAWDTWTRRLARFRSLWESRGIMPAFRALDAETGLRARLAAFPDGERILTNLLHLAELLNAAERAEKLAPAGLAKWLALMRKDKNARPRDGHEMRLESDARAVHVITAHKSKGLEFPVVFLPFALEKTRRVPERFIAAREDGRPVLWIAEGEDVPDEVRAADAREELCERIRLLYVALTRARSRCVVYLAGDIAPKDVENMALPSVLGAADWDDLKAKLGDCRKQLPGAIAVESRHTLPELASRATAPMVPALACRKFSRKLSNVPMLTSFSAIHSAGGDLDEEAVEAPERLDEPGVVRGEEVAAGIATFPRGAEAGTFFHSCLEKMDYSNPASWREVVAAELKVAGLDTALLDTALNNLTEVLETPLAPGGPILAGRKPSEIVREGEFYFPARGVDFGRLAAAFAGAGAPFAAYAPQVARQGFAGVEGYLKGYIDLVFRDDGKYCILDWKSNWLGPDAAHYTPDALDAAMRGNDYYLQGALYALALRRGMAARGGKNFAAEFGGVYYVFLRGADRSRPGSGVVYFNPGEALLDGVEAALGIGRAGV